MNLEGDLAQAYKEWRRLAEAEGKAIRAGDWRFVADCQNALSQLQPIIDGLVRQAGQGSSRTESGTASPQASRATVLELIELQRRNLASLEERRRRLSAHIEELSRTSRNLRSIQRSYASAARAGWTSYS